MQKRITRQVRIEQTLHRRLKSEAALIGVTISALVDKICYRFFAPKDSDQKIQAPEMVESSVERDPRD